MSPAVEYVCIHCAAPMERAIGPQLPGHQVMQCSAGCGAVSMRRVGDLYQAPASKKAARAPYWESPYRGGRLVNG